jgi:hypothetical protein
VEDELHTLVQVVVQTGGVAAGGEVAHTLVEDGVQQDGGGGGAVADLVVELPEDLADEHGADVLVAVGELDDAAGDDPAVVEEFGHLLVEEAVDGDDAGTGSQGRADGVDHLVDAALQTLIGGWLKDDTLSFGFWHANHSKGIGALAGYKPLDSTANLLWGIDNSSRVVGVRPDGCVQIVYGGAGQGAFNYIVSVSDKP